MYRHGAERYGILDSVKTPITRPSTAGGNDPLEGHVCVARWDWAAARTAPNPVSSFRSTIVVPPKPKKALKQGIFLFIGMQPAGERQAILQPVLQWGNEKTGGGSFWSVLSWYVRGDVLKLDLAVHTRAVPVEVGDLLKPAISLVHRGSSSFVYACEFEGISGTRIDVMTTEELVQPGIALECASVLDEDYLPEANFTSFKEIELIAGGLHLRPDWEITNLMDDHPPFAESVTHDGVADEILIRYR